jgi:ATP-dependent DNA helicase RecG
MRLRGYGDIIGFKQSGIKLFKIADPVHHENLFKLAEKNINLLNNEELNNPKYNFLLKLFDKVDLTNQEGTSS